MNKMAIMKKLKKFDKDFLDDDGNACVAVRIDDCINGLVIETGYYALPNRLWATVPETAAEYLTELDSIVNSIKKATLAAIEYHKKNAEKVYELFDELQVIKDAEWSSSSLPTTATIQITISESKSPKPQNKKKVK